jgi:sulfur carrier protein
MTIPFRAAQPDLEPCAACCLAAYALGKRIAVERNGEIVARGRHAETMLAEGDRIEIVVAVGGG